MVNKAVRTLAQTIEQYDAERCNAEINRFREMPSMKVAIKKAAESRKENGHSLEHQRKNWNFAHRVGLPSSHRASAHANCLVKGGKNKETSGRAGCR
jgi:hypothetical protein